jgi:transcriptional regulator with XRE-family HTH domain
VRLGITQGELAQKVGVAPPIISLWENEKAYPSDEQKSRVRQILGQIASNNESKSGAPNEDEETLESPSAIGTWLNRRRLEQGFSVPELADKAGLSSVAVYAIESGRSQNPQRKTVAKLEKALGVQLSTEVKKEATDEATIEGVGEWFNFDPHSKPDWPSAAGIYVLYDISDRPIYVGQGQNISRRLADHSDRFWFKQPIVQNAAYVGIEDKILREKIEKVLIKFLKSNAVLNQQNVDR